MISSIREQLKRHVVAICSLAIAVLGLGYNTWSHERTEANRTVRVAAFEVLKNLGELQLVVDYLHYQKDQNLGNPITGWGRVLLIKDLSAIIPEPAPREAERLFEVWQKDAWNIEEDEQAVERISQQIMKTRESVREILRGLK